MANRLSEDFINERALHLLLQIPVFTGQPGVRFDQWVRHVDNILEPTGWTNEDKVRVFVDRLSGQEYDVYESVRTDGITYTDLVKRIKDRYHGQETSAYYLREFEDQTRKPWESIADYAYSLKNIFLQAYSEVTVNEARFPFLKRAFLKGIGPQLRQALINFDYDNYEELYVLTFLKPLP